MRSPRLKLALITALLLASTAALDRLVYGHLIFLPDHAGGWDQFRWYAFEYHQRRLERSARDGRPLILFVGSSVAKYAVQKQLLEAELARRGISARVELIVHASLMAADLRKYLPRLLRLEPRVIVYLTNPADLDLERYTRPWEGAAGYQEDAFFEYARNRHPMLIFFPAAFAWEHRGRLPVEEQIRLYIRGASPGLRFRAEWFDALQFTARARLGQVRSYLNYQGIPLREGIWREGRTGGCFSLPRAVLEERPLLVQIVRDLQKAPNFRINAYSYLDGAEPPRSGRVPAPQPWPCRLPRSGRPLAELRPDRSGWQNLALPKIPAEHNRVYFALSHVELTEGVVLPVRPGMPAHSGLGLRLPAHLGLRRAPRNDYLTRHLALEDLRLALQSDREYERDFAKRVHPPDWELPANVALRQFNQLRLAKLILNWYDFSPMPLARDLVKLARAMPAQTRFVIVNNPENPLTRETYATSQWYRDYLAFLRSIGPRVAVHDLQGSLAMQDFSDAHHLTYYGMLHILPEYGRIVAEALQAGHAPRPR